MINNNTTTKHMVYAEDILYERMQYPNNAVYKGEIRRLIEKVVNEKEVTIGMCMPTAEQLNYIRSYHKIMMGEVSLND